MKEKSLYLISVKSTTCMSSKFEIFLLLLFVFPSEFSHSIFFFRRCFSCFFCRVWQFNFLHVCVYPICVVHETFFIFLRFCCLIWSSLIRLGDADGPFMHCAVGLFVFFDVPFCSVCFLWVSVTDVCLSILLVIIVYCIWQKQFIIWNAFIFRIWFKKVVFSHTICQLPIQISNIYDEFVILFLFSARKNIVCPFCGDTCDKWWSQS